MAIVFDKKINKTGLVVRRKINFGGDSPDPYFAEWREVSLSLSLSLSLFSIVI
jgi:hypothetical protein